MNALWRPVRLWLSGNSEMKTETNCAIVYALITQKLTKIAQEITQGLRRLYAAITLRLRNHYALDYAAITQTLRRHYAIPLRMITQLLGITQFNYAINYAIPIQLST